MLKQLKYEWRGRGLARGVALGLYVGIVGFLLLFGRNMGIGSFNGTPIFGLVMASLGMGAMLVVASVLAIESNGRLFKKPSAYFTMLTPTKGWEILGSRVVVASADFLVAIALGTAGVVAHLATVMDYYGWGSVSLSVQLPTLHEVTLCIAAVVSVLRYILLFYFSRTMIHSVYAQLPARTLLGIATFLVANWVWSFSDNIIGGSWGMPNLFTCLFGVIKLAALFIATSYLLEKKMNL